MAKESNIEEMKKEYEKIAKKHNLPSFNEMNEDFHIEKIAESETEILIREVRRYIGEKMSNYLRVVEAFLNPSNVPMFVFSTVKTISQEDKQKLSDIYKKLSKSEINIIELDLSFSEGKEAGFIRESFEIWQEIKRDFLEIIERVKKKWGSKSESAIKGYFG